MNTFRSYTKELSNGTRKLHFTECVSEMFKCQKSLMTTTTEKLYVKVAVWIAFPILAVICYTRLAIALKQAGY